MCLWHRIRKEIDPDSIFTEYPKFFRWAMDNYYEVGARLRKLDPLEPYSPDNCEFYMPSDAELQMTLDQRRQMDKWNRTVNVLRRFYGMEPFEEIPEEDVYGRTRKPERTEPAPGGAPEEM